MPSKTAALRCVNPEPSPKILRAVMFDAVVMESRTVMFDAVMVVFDAVMEEPRTTMFDPVMRPPRMFDDVMPPRIVMFDAVI